MPIFIFIVFFVILIYSSKELLHYSEKITNSTKITGALFGFLFISVITSLPELSTSIGANIAGNLPDMAFSDIVGSNAFNLFTLFVLFFIFKRNIPAEGTFYLKQYLPTFISLAVYYSAFIVLHYINIHWLGKTFSFALIIIYTLLIYKFNKKTVPKNPEYIQNDNKAKAKYIRSFSFFALLVILSGVLLALSGKRISVVYGLSASFIGALFLAIATSLPELTISLLSFKKSATVDFGIGNIIGSNIFNINIIALNDIFMRHSFYRTFSSKTLELTGLNIILTFFIFSFFSFKNRGWIVLSGALTYLIIFILIYA